ncbi:pimeloyl-ACP methyl ester carboxylesterase [Halarchaeum rubridurum]|uniref:Pimeloyl-ACP methyl ester carboxylesterase n=1 Tax=Halarchaeum rubridurum TaxID=489911 RepID=A0A8T4GMT2_9EURY|nr:alpha/beta hydrolase [Halarchaeum rubridurum]MBP1954535.1 pimeloyl-ACP methyl ester carboxylesterase [Halarchaeum rubridurum]
MPTVTSADGTRIAYERTGDGPPLVLVHGTAGHRVDWREVAPALAESFTLSLVERRGRGESGDAASYAIEHEYADVAAVVEHAAAEVDPDTPVSLLGHSYGAICALHAVRETDAVDRLVLYEPPLGDVPEPEGAAADIERLLREEGRDAATAAFLREAVGLSDLVIDSMRGDDLWRARLDAIPTVPREIRATQGERFDPAAFADVAVPTTLLLGGDSPSAMRRATESVADALPDADIVTLAGCAHMAMHADPEQFVDAVRDAPAAR